MSLSQPRYAARTRSLLLISDGVPSAMFEERTGLSIEQVARCQLLCSIPGDPGYHSLNLAQAVAAYLNALPRADQTSVVGWGAALGPLYRGHTLRDKPENRDLADYLVVYVSDVQTEKDTARLLDDPGPVFTARVLGVDYAWVVRISGRDGPQVPPTPTSP